MKKYLYLFRGGDARMAELSPEQMQEHMQKWGTWMQSLTEQKVLIDGLPLAKEGKRVKQAGNVILDGPYTEGAEVVGGYLIVNSESLDHAVEISKGCPIFENAGEVEVREILNM
ncbi:MAG: hypothetical protein D8M58_00475 [Calditrichaeota bacterium]|nr:MAG: hypothetical protein DWQ03_06605 [Calditrichota bacterium]MBL1203845.1 hypothetical protein [Calditrichota bacterium]NOG43677.1 hypothetical protein [Calditrichota bacterium]